MGLVRRPAQAAQVSQQDLHSYGQNYTLYLPKGYSKSLMVQNLIKNVDAVCVWDPSFNESDYSFYGFIGKNCRIEVLTICGDYQERTQLNSLMDNIHDCLCNNNIDFSLSIYAYSNKAKRYEHPFNLRLWHDRYLITVKDETVNVYLVGTSVSSILKGDKAFGLYKMENGKDKNVVLDAYDFYKSAVKDSYNGYILSISEPEDF